MPRGDVAIVLHAHLPFIRHPEHKYHLEENWLYEATTATYLPLLEVFRGLVRDKVRFRFTMSVSPPLTAMLADDLLKTRYASYLDRLLRLGESEIKRTAGGDPAYAHLAHYYMERFTRLKNLYDSLQGDVLAGFREVMEQGSLELITVGGTHGFQPVIREPSAKRAQIQVACESHERHFGRWPEGIWLPECGYAEGTDAILADFGIRYFFVDSHGVLNAKPQPPLGLYAPIYSPTGVAAFARDLDSSKQVWSAKEGYPGDANYRDFYRDIGFDLPLDYIGPYVHPDGIRVHTGFKYNRVTGGDIELSQKAPYNPEAARQKAAEHAANFMFNREKQVEHLAGQMDRRPLVVAPYDAELYGHWWFEGPMFLDYLARKIAFDQHTVQLTTCADYLDEFRINAVAEPSPSSWGAGGYSAVWVDPSNDWIYRHVHRAESEMHALARRYNGTHTAIERRALNQAARELLLAQSSDWAFIMQTDTAVKYACDRIKTHLARFRRIETEITSGRIDQGWLADLEQRDNIFPTIDFRMYN